MSQYPPSPSVDKFDLIVFQYIKRCRIISHEQADFKFINKHHKLIIQQYRIEQKKFKESINRYVNDLLFNEKCMIEKKNNLLIDAFYEVIYDDNKIAELKDMTDNIFSTAQHNIIDITFNERCKIIQKHLYYIIPSITANGNEECIICNDKINKIFFKKCKYCTATYHKSCLDKWLELDERCAMCRQIYYYIF